MGEMSGGNNKDGKGYKWESKMVSTSFRWLFKLVG